jgi:hypothetical protein
VNRTRGYTNWSAFDNYQCHFGYFPAFDFITVDTSDQSDMWSRIAVVSGLRPSLFCGRGSMAWEKKWSGSPDGIHCLLILVSSPALASNRLNRTTASSVRGVSVRRSSMLRLSSSRSCGLRCSISSASSLAA